MQLLCLATDTRYEWKTLIARLCMALVVFGLPLHGERMIAPLIVTKGGLTIDFCDASVV
jgi:hypothetical protein